MRIDRAAPKANAFARVAISGTMRAACQPQPVRALFARFTFVRGNGLIFKIAPQQLQSFERQSEAGFRERLLGLLRESFPDYASDQAATAHVVNQAVEDARMAGLQSERAIAAYVIAAFVLGLDIKDDPIFISDVREGGLNEAEKADWIEGWVGAVADALEG